jgi:hypothetical protein
VGLLTIWGRRIPVVIREGLWFLANFFPFYIWYIPVLVERTNYEISLPAYCKAEVMKGDDPEQAKDSDIGGKVDTKTAVTYTPDYKARGEHREDIGGERLIQFLNSGRQEGVNNILTDIVKEDIRDLALDFTWEEFSDLKTVLSARLIGLLTANKVRRLHSLRDADGKLPSPQELKRRLSSDPSDPERAFDRYEETLEGIDDILTTYVAAQNKAATKGDDESSKKAREDGTKEVKELNEDIFFFLNEIVTTGVADVRDLGINLTKFNVTHIFPLGITDEETQAAAAEKQQRRKERRDTETDIELAAMYVDASNKAGKEMAFADALKIVRVNKGHAKETIITGTTGNPILDAATIMKS